MTPTLEEAAAALKSGFDAMAAFAEAQTRALDDAHNAVLLANTARDEALAKLISAQNEITQLSAQLAATPPETSEAARLVEAIYAQVNRLGQIIPGYIQPVARPEAPQVSMPGPGVIAQPQPQPEALAGDAEVTQTTAGAPVGEPTPVGEAAPNPGDGISVEQAEQTGRSEGAGDQPAAETPPAAPSIATS